MRWYGPGCGIRYAGTPMAPRSYRGFDALTSLRRISCGFPPGRRRTACHAKRPLRVEQTHRGST